MNKQIFATAETYIKKGGDMAENLRDFLQDYLDAINVHPSYVNKDSPEFANDRERLKTEAGIVISNHPDGHFDIPAVLKAVAYRPDVKIMVKPEILENLAKIFGNQYLVPAARDLAGLRDVYREVGEHIGRRGVFVIFPGGGEEGIRWNREQAKSQGQAISDELPEIEFQRFVPSLIDNVLKPTNMVYSFYVNPRDIDYCLEDLTRRNVAIMPNLLREEMDSLVKFGHKTFRVAERYSQASEWQDLVKDIKGKGSNSAILTKHYLGQFGIGHGKD